MFPAEYEPYASCKPPACRISLDNYVNVFIIYGGDLLFNFFKIQDVTGEKNDELGLLYIIYRIAE